jgi:hypothetical protein
VYNGPSVLNADDLAAFLPQSYCNRCTTAIRSSAKTVALVLSLVSTSNPFSTFSAPSPTIQPRQRRPSHWPQRHLRNGPWSCQHERRPARADAPPTGRLLLTVSSCVAQSLVQRQSINSVSFFDRAQLILPRSEYYELLIVHSHYSRI